MGFNQNKADAAERAQFRAQAVVRASEQPEEDLASNSNASTTMKNAFAPRSESNRSESNSNQVKTLSHREEVLIKTIATHKHWTEQQVQEVKRRMTSNPNDFQRYIERLEEVYKNEIAPTLKKTISIDDWVNQNPHAVAFQFETASGEVKNQALSPEHPKYEDYKIYHGVRMKNVSSEDTPFPPPSELFRATIDTTVAESEEAFEEKKAMGHTEINSPSESFEHNQSVAQFTTRSFKM